MIWSCSAHAFHCCICTYNWLNVVISSIHMFFLVKRALPVCGELKLASHRAMAELLSVHKQAVEKLEDQLTCGVCLQPYTQPKVLHCFHIFCEDCLQRMVNQTAQGQTVECPKCRGSTPLPQNGVPGLQGAFFMSGVSEALSILKGRTCPEKMKCSKCKKCAFTCFCPSCGFICDLCKNYHTLWPELSSHKVIDLSKLALELGYRMPPHSDIQQCTQHRDKQLNLFCEDCKEMICQHCVLSVHENHNYGIAVGVSSSEENGEITHFGRVYDSFKAMPEKCSAEGPGLQVAVAGEISTATVSIVDQKGRDCRLPVDVSCELLSCNGSKEGSVEVQRINKGRYKVSYCAQHDGYHDLQIHVNGSPIPKSPFAVSVISATPISTIKDLKGPQGVAVKSNGQIIVTEHHHTHCVSILSGICGERVRLIGEKDSRDGEMKYPQQVALTDTEDILVCHSSNDQIQVFSPEGEFRKSVGTRGTGELQFKEPRGVAVNPCSKMIYMVDGYNNRVQILNEDYTFSRIFDGCDSSNASEKSFLKLPCRIALDADDNVYVADSGNNRVAVFTSDGEFREFGEKKTTCGKIHTLKSPYSIAIDSDGFVFVGERGKNCVSVFNRDREFLCSFGTKGSKLGQFSWPTDIAVHNGRIYVADYYNHRIQIFQYK